ncbi:hypothetical protein DSO57_1022754 [Entomophthora muscae]|uniref:Uncharacterized protein n=1 Tax=Entomophthora muscae TaxID=34485 RepID=A0ACC2TQP9_9FUNG|nr:hypothetical protein DSO57_1022754 [Entomophthora muscae]
MNHLIFTAVLTACLGIGGYQQSSEFFGPSTEGLGYDPYHDPGQLNLSNTGPWPSLVSPHLTLSIAMYMSAYYILTYFAGSFGRFNIHTKMPPKLITKATPKASMSKTNSPKAKKAKTTPKKQPAKAKAPPRYPHLHQSQRETVLPLLALSLSSLPLILRKSSLTVTLTLIQSLSLSRSVRTMLMDDSVINYLYLGSLPQGESDKGPALKTLLYGQIDLNSNMAPTKFEPRTSLLCSSDIKQCAEFLENQSNVCKPFNPANSIQ